MITLQKVLEYLEFRIVAFLSLMLLFLSGCGGASPPQQSPEITRSSDFYDLAKEVAKIVEKEAGGSVVVPGAGAMKIPTSQKYAVAQVIMNRVNRVNPPNRVTWVRDNKAFQHASSYSDESYSVALGVVSGINYGNAGGATHFYSPVSMPKQGQSTNGVDVGGGLEKVDPMNVKNYRPSWTINSKWTFTDSYGPAVLFKFYKSPPGEKM